MLYVDMHKLGKESKEGREEYGHSWYHDFSIVFTYDDFVLVAGR